MPLIFGTYMEFTMFRSGSNSMFCYQAHNNESDNLRLLTSISCKLESDQTWKKNPPGRMFANALAVMLPLSWPQSINLIHRFAM
jgi:hypothetical protein